MKKPKPQRKAIRAMKYEKRVADNSSFSDVLKASADHANKLAKRKEKKEKGK